MNRTAFHADLLKAGRDFGMRVFDSMGYRSAVEEVLDACGAREKRQRALIASLTVAFVVAMNIYRDRGQPRVFAQLVEWMRENFEQLSRKPVTDEALCHARRRLGVRPLAALFRRLAQGIRPRATFHGLATWTIDGVRFDMPDSVANRRKFGKWKASKGSSTAFPQMLAVALVASEPRTIRDIIFGRCTMQERPGALQFLEHLGSGDIVLLDRGFHAVWLFKAFLNQHTHFLARASSSYRPRILKTLGRGDHLVQLSARVPIPPNQRRRGCPKTQVVTLVLRMIESRIGRKPLVRLLTDLVDETVFPARELAEFYHERWEAELSNDELKTHLASIGGGGLHVTLRSKSPELALQEAYGFAIAYNLVRDVMAQAAHQYDLPPRELSFVESLDVIRAAAPKFERSMSPLQRQLLLQRMMGDLSECRLKRPRRPRVCPRAVRIKIKHFPRKRWFHRERRLLGPPTLRLVNGQSWRATSA